MIFTVFVTLYSTPRYFIFVHVNLIDVTEHFISSLYPLTLEYQISVAYLKVIIAFDKISR